MDIHLPDSVSASQLLYTVNSLSVLPFSSFSCTGHQKGHPTAMGSRSLPRGFPQPHSDTPIPTAHPGMRLTLIRPLLAETALLPLPREVSSFLLPTTGQLDVLAHPHATLSRIAVLGILYPLPNIFCINRTPSFMNEGAELNLRLLLSSITGSVLLLPKEIWSARPDFFLASAR